MTDRELMQQALEALELATTPLARDRQEVLRAQAALRERLAQPEQEPVAHTLNCVCGAVWDISPDGAEEMVHTPDATQQQRQWHSLTDEEIADIYIKWDATPGVSMADFARAIEAKLKEKNHG